MSIAKRSNPVEGHTGSGTSQATSAFGTSPVTGDTVVVFEISAGPGPVHQAPTDTASNTYTQIGTSTSDPDGQIISVWRKENCTGGSSFAVTAHIDTASQLTVIAWCLSGANTPTSYNGDSVGANGNGANPASGTSSPAPAANSFFLAGVVNSGADNAVTAGSGWEFVTGSKQGDNTSFQSAYTEELTSPNTSSSAQNGQFTAVAAGWGARVASFAPTAGPAITAQPQHNSVLAGQPAVFTIAATTSGGALSYQWKFNGSNVGSNAATYGRVAVLPDDGGAITCDVTDDNGTTSSTSATLGVRRSRLLFPRQQRMR